MWSPTFDLPEAVVWFDVMSFLEEILKIYFGLIVIFNFFWLNIKLRVKTSAYF